MKRTFLILAILCATMSYAQKYKPLLVDGKRWELAVFKEYRFDDDKILGTLTLTVMGDTLVYGKTCKKIWADYGDLKVETFPKYIVAREDEDGKVFKVDDEGNDHVFLDMGWEKRDHVPFPKALSRVGNQGIVTAKGEERKWLLIDSGFDGGSRSNPFHVYDEPYFFFLVEGVGYSKDSYLHLTHTYPYIVISPYFHRMKACYENGECIFTYENFINDVTGIATPKSDTAVGTDLYDLSGRKLHDTPKGIPYIRDGKKFFSPMR